MFKVFLVCFSLLLSMADASAGLLSTTDIHNLLEGRYIVGEKLTDIPAYPLFVQNPATPSAKPDLAGYAFETIDLEPVRGYSGKPVDLLVVMDTSGVYRDVRLIDHKEPFFLNKPGTIKLMDFASQYIELSLQHTVEVLYWNEAGNRDAHKAELTGVHHGTVTAKAINRSILSSAAMVAMAKLNISADSAAAKAMANATQKRAHSDSYTPLKWDALIDNHLVTRTRVSVQQLSDTYAGSNAPVNDLQTQLKDDQDGMVFHTTLLADPLAGRNLLDAEGWRYVTNKRRTQQALLVTFNDHLDLLNKRDKWLTEPQPFTLLQNGKDIKLQLIDYEKGMSVPGYPKDTHAYFLLAEKATPLDPSQPFELSFHLKRRYGSNIVLNKTEEKLFAVDHQFHGWRAALTDFRYTNWLELDWVKLWLDRQIEIGVLLIGLILLTTGLVMQKRTSADARILLFVRTAYLCFTLGFIGWYAQGQLTVVNITSAIASISSGGGLDFLLNDPISSILWVFVFGTLLVWGRGTFCGWLCPFGALQELISMVANRLGLHQKRLRQSLDKKLKWVKYILLLTILGSLYAAPAYSDYLTKVEPFETAITYYFVHDWPYVAWAVACLTLGLLVYRGYCRYLCPLGAALAAVNVLQSWSWIPRREACGTPCQTCRHRCEYQAIEPTGKIDYAECFQCLDCVSIYQDDEKCFPLIQMRKSGDSFIPVSTLTRQ
ncbi:MAG: 4Fe-4S binding protein [Limnohabitans sp.]|nr:4Fe-4S binding protein [Limnohabitans sp.]